MKTSCGQSLLLIMIAASSLVSCQIVPVTEAPSTSTATQPPQDEILLLQLRSDSPQERLTALQDLAKQPRLARRLMSAILPLLADERMLDDASYLGSGYYSGRVTSPAEEAAGLLAKMGTWAVLPLRLRLHDPNPVVRRYAIKALGEMVVPEHIPWLMESLQDEHPGVVKEAYAALLRQDAQLLVQSISEVDFDKLQLHQQLMLIQLLGASHHTDALLPLQQYSRYPLSVVRSAAYVALMKFPDSQLSETVLRGLRDTDPTVRENAILLAPLHNNTRVLSAVIEQLKSSDDAVRRAALEVLPFMTNQGEKTVEGWQQWWRGGRHRP